MSEKHTNPDLDGLVRFHAYAAFAHGTMLYLTFGYNVKIFGLSILDGFQAQPSILVTAPTYAWLLYGDKVNSTTLDPFAHGTEFESIAGIANSTLWQENCVCRVANTPSDTVDCDTAFCRLEKVTSMHDRSCVSLQSLFVVYFMCSFVQHCFVLVYNQYYRDTVLAGRGWWPRWLEYALSAACMSAIVLVLQAETTTTSLYMGITITATTMGLGYVIEQLLYIGVWLCDENFGYAAVTAHRTAENRSGYDSKGTKDLPVLQNLLDDDNRDVSDAIHERLRAIEERRLKIQNVVHILVQVLYSAAFVLQFFGLWYYPFIMAFYNSLADNGVINKSCALANDQVDCGNGPPSWVKYAIIGTAALYTYFGLVMFARIQMHITDIMSIFNVFGMKLFKAVQFLE